MVKYLKDGDISLFVDEKMIYKNGHNQIPVINEESIKKFL